MAFCLTFFLTGLAGDFLVVKPEVQAVIVVVLGAFPMAIFGILPQAMVADIAQCETVETGENRSGMFFAARTFAFKFGQSVAMLTFTSLATLGYRLVAITASIFCLIGGFCLLRYNEKRILEKIENDN